MSLRCLAWTTVFCLMLASMAGAAWAKEDAPEGYEDAAAADAPVADSAKKAKPKPAAGVAAKARKKKGRADKAKPGEVPEGYEDAASPEDEEENEEENVRIVGPGMGGGGLVGAVEVPRKRLDKADPQVVQWERNYRPQFQQLLKTELAFFRRACDPDPAQRAAVAKAGEACMADVLTRCAIAQVEMMQGQGRSRRMPNASQELRRQLIAIAAKSLRPEQLERYRREAELSSASRKRMTVDFMVAKTDQMLVLSTQQRERLVAALTKDYSDAWEQAISIWMNNVQFAPSIPDADILPLLSEEQKAVWRESHKLNIDQISMHSIMLPHMATIQEE